MCSAFLVDAKASGLGGLGGWRLEIDRRRVVFNRRRLAILLVAEGVLATEGRNGPGALWHEHWGTASGRGPLRGPTRIDLPGPTNAHGGAGRDGLPPPVWGGGGGGLERGAWAVVEARRTQTPRDHCTGRQPPDPRSQKGTFPREMLGIVSTPVSTTARRPGGWGGE